MSARFTVDGSDALERNLADLCRQVLAGIQARLPAAKIEALLLGGGYGRGEGGVLAESGGDQPYNDLEFFVGLRGATVWNEFRHGKALHETAHALSQRAGIEIELKTISLGRLRRAPVTMTSYDLVMGHRWILGEEALLDGCGHHRDPARIPLAEATRLLMNRCSGLLFAKERLRRQPFTADDADFVGRNLAKARLAFGDVALTVHGRYHWSCRMRERILAELESDEVPCLAEVKAAHRQGVAFKLHPNRATGPAESFLEPFESLSHLGRQLWLWLEEKRLSVPFPSVRDYALSPVLKCPETSPWRNRLVNGKAFGMASLVEPRSARYPRERLLQSLPLLLWDSSVLASSELQAWVQSELRTGAVTFSEWVAAYGRLWSRFN